KPSSFFELKEVLTGSFLQPGFQGPRTLRREYLLCLPKTQPVNPPGCEPLGYATERLQRSGPPSTCAQERRVPHGTISSRPRRGRASREGRPARASGRLGA